MRQKASHGPVVVAAVLFFLCMPEGIPFLYAACSSPGTAGTVNPFGVNRCDGCMTDGQNPGSDLVYGVSSCTIFTEATKCEMTVNVNLVINEVGCKVFWSTQCAGSLCHFGEAGTGLLSGLKTMTVRCNASENMEIRLGSPEGCETCSPTTCLIANGTCNPG